MPIHQTPGSAIKKYMIPHCCWRNKSGISSTDQNKQVGGTA
jgi:hypothetical protein